MGDEILAKEGGRRTERRAAARKAGLIAGLLALAILPAAAETLYEVNHATRAFLKDAPIHWRDAKTHAIVTEIWYPAASGRFPLILISHGTGGSAGQMAWLATTLAAHGYIAAAVNHPGNNGTEPYQAKGFILWWERPKDLSRVLDAMLADKEFGARIDTERIGAAGFSLGGYTMLSLAGGITDFPAFELDCEKRPKQGYCQAPREFPDILERFAELKTTDPEVVDSLKHSGDAYRDPRVKAVYAVAPALDNVFTRASLEAIKIPVSLVVGSADGLSILVRYAASRIPGAEFLPIPEAGHYTFLAVCAPEDRERLQAICVDRPGVDRQAVHDQVALRAVEFFNRRLPVSTGERGK